MTTLDSMPKNAELPPPDRLQSLVQAHAARAREWRMKLPTLRAQSSATSFMLRELARTPPGGVAHKSAYADVVLAAPTKQWADQVANRLRRALPSGAQVDLMCGEPQPQAQPLTSLIVRYRVSLPGVPGMVTTEQVRAALARMEELETRYSETLGLVVVAPSC
jgi:hypothetical protein